jgi:hypothetical protein
MPNLDDSISGFVRGDDLDIRRTIQNIPSGQTLTDAWMTVRATNLATVIFTKQITTVLTAGQGQITDNGATDQEGAVWFQLRGGETGDTVLLAAGTAYPFDIQTKTSSGKFYTPVKGTITSTEEITRTDI